MATDLGSMLINGARVLPELSSLIYMLAFLSGIIMFAWGIQTAKAAHESSQQRGTYRQAAYIVLAATMLINASLTIGIWSETLLGVPQEPPASILSYDNSRPGTTELSKQSFMAIIAFVQFVGLLAFVRGWHILPRIGERHDATLGKALTHIIGGVCAVNILTFAKITAWTFGLTTIGMLLGNH